MIVINNGGAFACQNMLCRIRVPYPFQWGAPTFEAGEAFAMMAAAFVALVEVHYSLFFCVWFVAC